MHEIHLHISRQKSYMHLAENMGSFPESTTTTMPTSPATPRSDSPILPSFPRRLSSATTGPTLPRISEQPQLQLQPRPQYKPHDQTFLYSPTIASPKLVPDAQCRNYTFSDGSSSTSSSPSSSASTSPSSTNAPALPHKMFPSCLSLQNLGYEDEQENDDCVNWNEGWEIATPPAGATEGPVKKNSGPYGRLPTPEIPLIREGEFRYYPTPKLDQVTDQNNGDDGSLKLARRRLIERNNDRGRSGFGKWLRDIWAKLRSGRR
jgi:hypothetical protein